MIRDRFGKPLQLVRWASLDDVRRYEAARGREPDAADRYAVRRRWYVVVFDGTWLVVKHLAFLVGDAVGEVENSLAQLR